MKIEKNKNQWIDNGSNYFLQRKGYYISYNPYPLAGYGGAETALVKEFKNRKRFSILLGDFRNEYEKCRSYKEAYAFFKKNEDKKGFCSN